MIARQTTHKPYRSHWLIRRPDPIDWFRLLADLQGFGWSNADVARSINVPPSTLAEWKHKGRDPSFEDGRALILLHTSVCEIRLIESPSQA